MNLTLAECDFLTKQVDAIIAEAPLFMPAIPGKGTRFRMKMTNAGPWGWMSDQDGYLYVSTHPITGRPWPAIPQMVLYLCDEACDRAGVPRIRPEAMLVNVYHVGDQLGTHQDVTEECDAAVVSISLGLSAKFWVGGKRRYDDFTCLWLSHGKVVVLAGPHRSPGVCFEMREQSNGVWAGPRYAFHRVDSPQIGTCGTWDRRINLTIRQVRP